MHIDFQTLEETLHSVLIRAGFPAERAGSIARTFAETTFDGVFSHGINRFPRFMGDVASGIIDPHTGPSLSRGMDALEQWDGNHGAGITNALHCTDRAMELSRRFGMGCVGLRNTNHWMRGGTYGWRAAEQGYLFMGWTNTLPNMPPWGGESPSLGNNPLVMALPRKEGPVVLDMAMSQYSYGKLEWQRRKGGELPEFGGFDRSGHLTRDPAEILHSQRILPAGLWKGSALSLVLDLSAAILSGGKTTVEVGRLSAETEISQVFIAVDLEKIPGAERRESLVRETLDFIRERDPGARHPGQGSLEKREHHRSRGIEIPDELWEEILGL